MYTHSHFYSCPKVSTSNATFKIVNFCGIKEINITNTIYILFSQTSESLFIIVNEMLIFFDKTR